MGYFKLFLEQLFDAAFFCGNAFYRVFVWTEAPSLGLRTRSDRSNSPHVFSIFKKSGHFHWD